MKRHRMQGRSMQRARRLSRQRQQGVAVITALLLTTLAITIVASLFWQQQVQVRSIENQRLQLQKLWILRGALDWASLILREDAKYSKIDSLDEPWAVPLSNTRLDQYVENNRSGTDAGDATVSGRIEDAQGRYNLANLATDGKINPAEVAVLERLLSNARLNAALALPTAQAVADSQRSASVAGQRGRSSGALAPVVPAAQGGRSLSLLQVEDLLAIPGYSVEMVDKLRDFVIILPAATPVNVNTAPPEVLAARLGLSESEGRALATRRKNASFRDLADFTQRSPGVGSVPPSALSVSTRYFLVNGMVSIDRAGLEVQALIERNGAHTKLLWIRQH